jgi:hypothetical protein
MEKIFVVYLTMYSGDKLPKWYIGSSYEQKVLNGYNGSVKSKEFKDIYKSEQKVNKHLFKTRIISFHKTQQEAINEELRLHHKHNVVINKKYFNKSLASVNGFFGMNISGELHPMFGRTHSEKTKQKISEANSGKTHSIESKAKMSGENNHNFGKKLSKEHKQKISEANSGEKNINFGKAMSDKTKQKLSKTNLGRIWIKNLIENISKKINTSEFAEYEKLGWIKGRISFKISEAGRKSKTGKIWIKNLIKNTSKLINTSEFAEYEKLGWIKGRN